VNALRRVAVVFAVAFAGATALAAQQREDGELRIWPAAIQLDDGADHPRIAALWRTPSGATVDCTGCVAWSTEGGVAELVREGETLVLRARRDGDGELVATFFDAEVRAPLHVRNAAVQAPVSFRNDVIPLLTRNGCNAGSCHGAASGKEGFGLSLFGYDPTRDHLTLTRDLRARRVDPADPAMSLMLQKATASAPHKGGKRFAVDSPAYRALFAWIAAGAPDDKASAPALLGIDVLPNDAVLVGREQRLPLQVRARYADGSDRDVTELALWGSNNDGAAAVSTAGVVTSHDAGEACVLARFSGFAVAAQVLVLADDRAFTWPDVPEQNFVDARIHAKLRRARIAPADVCSDSVFVRRVHLDLLNTLPTPAETQAFLADAAPDKRARLVDALLQRPEWALAQAMQWAEVLQVDQQTMEPKGAALLTRWLQDGFAAGRAFDAMVRDLLVAEGSTFADAPANFYLAATEPHLVGERVAQNFLGVRLQCAQCHNHPFENWTMDDYYGFAAFFAQVGRKRGEDPYEQIVWDRRNGSVRNKRDNVVAEPRFLGGGLATVPQGTDRRRVLADWLCAPGNAFFAKNVANRVWARLLGRGLVDPPDDVRVGNPASHPELLDDLAHLLAVSQFDLRAVYRTICASRTYQLARHPDLPSAALFAGNHVRRLSAEQMLDAIGAVTGAPTKYPGVPLGEPATAIARGRTGVRFLDTFGRPARDGACTCERRVEPTLGQTLHLVNGDTIADKIAAKDGRLARALAAKAEPEAMLADLFLAAYSRAPTSAERERVLPSLAAATDAHAAWSDLYWAVLNSREFAFQH
jgi:hypothetical protein